MLGEASSRAIQRPLASGWLTQGPEVAAFEREFAAFVGAPHACAVSNCTTALHLALRAARRRRRRRGHHRQPFVHRHGERDSLLRRRAGVRRRRAGHLQHRSRRASRRRSPSGRARFWWSISSGMPCDLDAIVADRPAPRPAGHRGRGLRRRQRDPLARRAGSAIGRPHGDIACFSFHPRKVMTTGDGGMLTTSQPGVGSAVPAVAPALDDGARHGAARVAATSSSSSTASSASTIA